MISELQGGDNDPEQVLDTELTATAFRAHTYRHPTIGWLHDLQSMTRDDLYAHYRRYYVPEQRHAGRRRRRGMRRRAAAGRAAFRPDSCGARAAPAEGRRAAAARRAACDARARGDDRLPEVRLPRARGDRSRFLPDARARCGADRSEGAESLVEFPRRAAAAESRGCIRRSSSADSHRRSTARCSRRPIRFSTRCRSRRPRACRCRCSRRRCSRRSSRLRQVASRTARSPAAKRQLRARLVFEDDSVTNVAHQLGFFETVVGPGFYPRLQAVHRRGDRRAGARRRAAPPAAQPADGRLVPAAGVALMAASLAQGLSPVREELANGAVILLQETVDDAGGHDQRVVPRRQHVRSCRSARPRLSDGPRDRSRDDDAERRRDGRRARRPRRLAAGVDEPAGADRLLHLPGGGFRRRARDRRGRRAQSDVSRRRRSRSAGPRRSRSSARTRTTLAPGRSKGCSSSSIRRLHPYGRPSKGTALGVEQVSRADMVAFHARADAARGAVAGHRRRRRRRARARAAPLPRSTAGTAAAGAGRPGAAACRAAGAASA